MNRIEIRHPQCKVIHHATGDYGPCSYHADSAEVRLRDYLFLDYRRFRENHWSKAPTHLWLHPAMEPLIIRLIAAERTLGSTVNLTLMGCELVSNVDVDWPFFGFAPQAIEVDR